MSQNNQTIFFSDEYLTGLITAEYLVLRFSSVCDHNFGFGQNAPYLYFTKGEEQLHLISAGGVPVRHGCFGIYKAGNIVRYQFLDDYNRGFKLMSAVVPVMELSQRFTTQLSTVGRSARCYHNFGPNGEYPVVCVLDRDSELRIRNAISQNTACEVSILNALGTEDGLPLVSVVVHKVL